MRDKEVLKQKTELGKDVRNTVGLEQREQVILLDGKRDGGAWSLATRQLGRQSMDKEQVCGLQLIH